MKTIEEYKEIMIRVMASVPDLTFAELHNHLGDQGEYRISLPKNENVVIWSDLTENACRAFDQLMAENVFSLDPTNVMNYLADGRSLSLPLVQSKADYKTPHWLPVMIKRGKNFPQDKVKA